MTDVPPGYTAAQRDQPGGFTGESDVFDTWFTSSLTPQISSRWLLDPARHAQLFPADIRPQSHEIIRTWAFYTIAKALLHEDTIPWRHVVVSGWILDPDRKKMSKSKGNVVTPVAPDRGAHGRRRPLLGRRRAPRHRHRLRREGDEDREAARHQALQRRQVRPGAGRRRGPHHRRARPRVRRTACATWSSASPRRSTPSTTRTPCSRPRASSGTTSPTPTSSW